MIVGPPTQKFRATGATTGFLKDIPKDGLNGVKVAAFDTRLTACHIERIRILALFVRFLGYTAKPIANRLENKGGQLAVPPEGFYVADTKGPLLEGEVERAAEWARRIIAALENPPGNMTAWLQPSRAGQKNRPRLEAGAGATDRLTGFSWPVPRNQPLAIWAM